MDLGWCVQDGVKAVEEKITDAQEGGEVRRGVINKKHEDEVGRG